jgi:membrane-anchored protein YejM (alkaline phosphatase superfamily)
MRITHLLVLAGRLLVATFVVLTGGYCLLAYIPFTFHQIHMGGLLPWLSSFAQYHPLIYWPVLIIAAATLPNLRNDRSRALSISFLFVYLVIGVNLAFNPLLVKLQNNVQSLYWCLFSFLPLIWFALIDWRAQRAAFIWEQAEGTDNRRTFWACLVAAFFSWLLSALLVLLRYSSAPNTEFHPRQWAVALLWSLVCQAVLFMVIFLALSFTGAIAAIRYKHPGGHVRFYIVLATVLLALALKLIVFTPLSFSGALSTIVALAISFSVVVFVSGIAVRFYRKELGPIESPLALLFTPIRFLRSRGRIVQIVVLLAGSALGLCLIVRVTTMDWEYMIQKLLVVAIWAGLFAFFYTTAPAFRKRSADWLLIVAAVVVCAYVAIVALQPRWSFTAQAAGNEFLEEYSNYDVSFHLAREVLLPPAAVAASSDDSLYGFLVGNTNIPRSVVTRPVDISLAGKLAETPGPKPNIFIFVIDSLRRDYISAYNPAVNFTPAIGAFASESVAVPNAFTRYTGTGLSEPSIWAGSMLLHKQYVLPFYPMNSLQKLLDFEKYQQFITKDEILSTILAPSPLITELDAGRPTMSCELCRSLAELQTKLTAAGNSPQPIFAYTQPQNIHVSVINREGSSVPPGENYPGFNNAYASRVKAMDKCFGDFIQFLKSSGLYDNSIIILTSDHGDSLGERGRWGHAYNVVPEVVRVPLIIHLPPAMRSLAFNRAAPSFLIDITPSIYYLLGHQPIVHNELFGRPLFTTDPEEVLGYLRTSYLVASSYGPVYALLENGGHSLYVADGVEYTDHLYEWEEGPSVSSSTITPEIRADRQQQIRNDIGAIDRFYNFNGTTEK